MKMRLAKESIKTPNVADLKRATKKCVNVLCPIHRLYGVFAVIRVLELNITVFFRLASAKVSGDVYMREMMWVCACCVLWGGACACVCHCKTYKCR